ncbi:MAG: hypothetical protein H7X92_06030, partial [Chitinophagales bacterium]|nr:hypothetical protein [Hyphomicrobiales bacterium]
AWIAESTNAATPTATVNMKPADEKNSRIPDTRLANIAAQDAKRQCFLDQDMSGYFFQARFGTLVTQASYRLAVYSAS